jgi:chromosome segregation ATPase
VAQAFQRPILLTLGIFVIGLIYVGIRKIIPKSVPVEVVRVEEERARGLTTTLKEFCSNYEEKTALTLEIEKLAEDRRKGRLSKRAYVEEVQHDRRRIASLTNSINEAKNKLVPANKRYAAMIKQLDTYEEERENARASLDNLELRRRQGKVSGDVYNRLKYENTKKIEKATSGIDSVVVELRQETF